MEGTLNIKAFRKRSRIEQLEVTVAGLKALTEAQLDLLMKYRRALEAIASGVEHPTDIAERILGEDRTHAISNKAGEGVLRTGAGSLGERRPEGESRASELPSQPNNPSVATGEAEVSGLQRGHRGAGVSEAGAVSKDDSAV